MLKIKQSILISYLFLFSPLAFAEEAKSSSEALVFTCYTCHGTDGKSPGNIPTLNGLSSEIIIKKMRAFQKDESESTIMNRIAKGYAEDEITLIADYLAAIK
ncbi:MAG: cytochrome c [Gammaproteobacteria bacterium]